MGTNTPDHNVVESDSIKPDEAINLCGKSCPETFVEAKLALENLDDGQQLEVTVDDPGSAERVPRNMENHGQLHVRTEQQDGVWKMIFERKQDCDRKRWVMMD